MNTTAVSRSAPSSVQLPYRNCPACGMPAPAVMALLPSGRRAFIETCAICGRQKATPVSPQQAWRIMKGKDVRTVEKKLA